MTFDSLVLGVIAFVAVWGAFTGFARQVAQALAGIGALLAASPSGHFFGEPVAKSLQSSLTVGVVVATIFSFLVIYLVVKLVMTAVIRRIVDGKESSKRRGTDRLLGFLLSGAKASVAAWVMLSAATFVENNLVLAGKKYTFTPKDSKLVALARRFNFIEEVQFSGAKDLIAAAKLADDPKAPQKFHDDPDYLALMRDPRFRQILESDTWKKAMESGDVRVLMQNNGLVELMQDPKMSHHLERLASHGD